MDRRFYKGKNDFNNINVRFAETSGIADPAPDEPSIETTGANEE